MCVGYLTIITAGWYLISSYLLSYLPSPFPNVPYPTSTPLSLGLRKLHQQRRDTAITWDSLVCRGSSSQIMACGSGCCGPSKDSPSTEPVNDPPANSDPSSIMGAPDENEKQTTPSLDGDEEPEKDCCDDSCCESLAGVNEVDPPQQKAACHDTSVVPNFVAKGGAESSCCSPVIDESSTQPEQPVGNCKDACCSPSPVKALPIGPDPECCEGKTSTCCDTSCIDRVALRECSSKCTDFSCENDYSGRQPLNIFRLFEPANSISR